MVGRSSGRRIGIAALVVLVAVAIIARPEGRAYEEPQQTPTFRTGIDLVRVDVVATDRDGRQVSNLTENDFEITDEGKRQTISAFKLVTSDGGRDSTTPLAT